MSKFKVGDKVETPFGIGEIIVFNYFLEKDKSYKVRLNYKMDDTHAYEYGKTPLLNFTEKEIKPYKTPHQELLDLGWKVLDDRNNIMLYHLLVDGKFYYQIKIDKLHKTIDLHYLDRSGYTSTTQLDLKLTSILKRYLEELE